MARFIAIHNVPGITEEQFRESLGAVSKWRPDRRTTILKVYGDQREADWKNLTITFTPAEIGRMSLFLPRVIEGVSAIDKLNQAGLLAYRGDDHIPMNPSLARGFYQYLRELHSVVAPGGPGRNQ